MGRQVWVVNGVTSQPFPGGLQWRGLLPTWFLSTPWGHQSSGGMAQALLIPPLWRFESRSQPGIQAALRSAQAFWTQLRA